MILITKQEGAFLSLKTHNSWSENDLEWFRIYFQKHANYL